MIGAVPCLPRAPRRRYSGNIACNETASRHTRGCLVQTKCMGSSAAYKTGLLEISCPHFAASDDMNDASWMSIRKALSIQWGAISIPAALPSRCLEVISIYILVGTMSAVSVVLGSGEYVAPWQSSIGCGADGISLPTSFFVQVGCGAATH